MSAWTKDQFEEWCNQHSLNASKAFRTGEISLAPKDEQRPAKPAKKPTKGPPAPGVSYTERKQDPKLALESPLARAQPRVEDPGRHPRVHIIIRGCRLRFLDPDNFVAGCKATLDGLVAAGIAPDDSQEMVASKEVQIDYEQQLVTSSTKECTEIEIIWNEVPRGTMRNIDVEGEQDVNKGE